MDKPLKILQEEFADAAIEADEKRKASSLFEIEKAVEEKKIFYYPSPVQILLGQIKFSAGYFMGLQCIFSILMLVFIQHMKGKENSMYAYLAVLSAFAAFINVFMMVELNRNFSYRMAEIEQSCYLNLKQLCACKMVCFGGTELVLLSVLLIVTGKNMEMGIFRFGVYIMVPFLLANLIYLFIFTECRRIEKDYAQYMLALLLGMTAVVPTQFEKVYEPANFGVWLLLLAAAISGLCCEGHRMLQGLEENEECWN